MSKLKLQLDELVVESFATADGKDGRGTVQGYISCNTCEDLNCSVNCTGGTCGTDPATSTCPPGTNNTACGPGGSDPNASCYSDAPDCYTYYVWTGCDYSCEFRPCRV